MSKCYDEKQKLIDVCFQIALLVSSEPSFRELNEEAMADWVAHQLAGIGFPTKRMEISWGVLVKSDESEKE